MPNGTARPQAAMGGKKMTLTGRLRAASTQKLAPSDYTVIRNPQGEPTGVTRPMPDEKAGAFAGQPVKVKQVDLAKPASFQEGGVVKKSGWAQVEKGERVIPAAKAALSGLVDRAGKAVQKYNPLANIGEEAKGVSAKAQNVEQYTSATKAKPPNFKRGGVVKKSGWAQVEKGEKVVPKDKAMADEKRDRGKGTMGGKGKKKKASKGGKKRVHKMTIRHAKSGGYIVEHHAKPENGQTPEPPEEHAVPDMEGLQQHVADNMGQEPEPQQAPPPVPAAGGAGAAGGGAMPPPGA